MLRRACYCTMYLNNYVYIEEYIAVFLTIVIATFNIPAALIFLVVALLLFSPRKCWDDRDEEKFTESPNTTRPHTGAFAIGDKGLVDGMGRKVFLRGVNVNGKLPLGHTTWIQPPRRGSFVGSLFELDSIDQHLLRLASCGYTLLRLNVTWEALEPIAEGYYDASYITYLVSVVRACERYGMWVVIDSHQDAWSRWTGGDGAPKWTMDQLGMNPDMFTETRSAMLHGEDSGHMTWFTNYTLYGAGTMFALFFGGKRFAPKTTVRGQNVQEWLQTAYIKAWREVAKALAGERNVLGFEPMNEPNGGWIGLSDLKRNALPAFIGWDITPWDAIRLANGSSVNVSSFPSVNAYGGTEKANPNGRSVWRAGYTDVWKENGVYGKTLLKPDYFKLGEGETFERDFLTPFHQRFADAILEINPRWWVVCYPVLQNVPTAVSSPHWYDNITLSMNRYIPYLALSDDQTFIYPWYAPHAHKKALERLIPPNEGPFFLGEVGIPWLDRAAKTGKALEATLAAVDSRFISAITVWNYNPHHIQDKGDGWNLEDFSIWTPELAFRMPTAVRPYAMVLAGTPITVHWEPFSAAKTFVLEFYTANGRWESNTSLIFVPRMHFGTVLSVWTSDDGRVQFDERQQIIEYKHRGGKGGKKEIRISKA